MSKVYATSSAVNGCPSDHVTPLRIVKVIDLLSALHLYPDASIGVSSWLRSTFTNTSGSYTKPMDSRFTDGLNGLNWHVQVWPCSLEIVTVPPCLCAPAAAEPEDDPDAEPEAPFEALLRFLADPVQAVTARATAAMAAA